MLSEQQADQWASREDFDAFLGPGEYRYFSQGYRRVSHLLGQVACEIRGDQAVLTGSAAVAYPSDWSHRGSVERAPHLSTLDAMVLAARLCEVYLAEGLGLGPEAVTRAWVARMSVRAGAHPGESLARIAVSATGSPADATAGSPAASRLDARIGPLSVAMLVHHEVPPASRRTVPREVRAPATWGPHTGLFKATALRSEVVSLDAGEAGLTCRHEVLPASDVRATGLAAAYWPQVALADCLVLGGQMAQVLVQAVRGLDRDQAGDLWMRRVTFETTDPRRPPGRCEPSVAHVIGQRAVATPAGVLHGFEAICPDLCGVTMAASVAYLEAAR